MEIRNCCDKFSAPLKIVIEKKREYYLKVLPKEPEQKCNNLYTVLEKKIVNDTVESAFRRYFFTVINQKFNKRCYAKCLYEIY